MTRALSDILKEMACTVLAQPEAEPSSEAPHAALLFAHVAWNRAVASEAPGVDYRFVLRQFEVSNPRLWNELRSSDAEALITELVAYKRAHHRNDRRQVLVCGMLGANVHVEWVDPLTD